MCALAPTLLLALLAPATAAPACQRPIGCAIEFLGLEQVPPDYVRAVHAVRALRLVHAAYVRPQAAWHDGGASVLGAIPGDVRANRVVQVDDEPMAHVRAAAKARLPDPCTGSVSSVLLGVVEQIVAAGDDLPRLRQRQGQGLCDVVDSLQRLDALCVQHMPDHVRFVCAGVRIASIGALVEGLDWPHVKLPQLLCEGFPVCGSGGDGEPGMEDTGVYLRLLRPAAHSLRELVSGRAAGFVSNARWLGRVVGLLRGSADRARTEQDRATLRAAEELCDKEVRALPRPTMMPPLTLNELSRWARRVYGSVNVLRPMVSFVLRQGQRADGTDKFRRIDNAKGNGLNGATRTVETVVCISFMFPILLARAFADAARRQRVAPRTLWIGLDDLKAAYRTIPVAALQLSVIAVWSVRRTCAMFYRLPGHAFGLVASVVNFCCFAHFVCFVAQVVMLVAVDHFVDDFVFVDPASAENSAHDGLRLVLILIGFDVELSKRQWAAPSNTVLGVMVNIATAHRPGGHAFAEPTESRVRKVLAFLRACATAGRITATEASKLRGLLGFTLLPVNFKFGRAACQPLAHRANGEASSTWTRPMRAMHAFFERTLPRLPPLRVPMQGSRMRPVLVYTDASFTCRRGRRRAVLGFYVYDPVSGVEYHSKLVLPQQYYRYLSPGRKTYIAQAELAVGVGVWYTLPELLRGRAVMQFIDNTVALAAIVKGYASRSDCAVMVNCFHEAVFELQSYLWAEYIPSKANVGDWPTRQHTEHLIPSSSSFVEMVLPPMERFAEMLDF